MNNNKTGLYDVMGIMIDIGDILLSEYQYLVMACYDDERGYYGSLICPVDHACRNMIYSLNGSFTIVYKNTIKR